MQPTKQLPPGVVEALQRGELMEAIKLLRASGITLKDARSIIEMHATAETQKREAPGGMRVNNPSQITSGLSPGEVPRSADSLWWVIALAFVAYVLYLLYLRVG